MLQAVERWKAEIHQLITANMQSAMSQAEGYVDRLEQEILELQRRDAELRQILETEDNIHFLQVPESVLNNCTISPQKELRKSDINLERSLQSAFGAN